MTSWIEKTIFGFFYGIFLYILLFLLLNVFGAFLLNIYSIPLLFITCLLLGHQYHYKNWRNTTTIFSIYGILFLIFIPIFYYVGDYSVDGNRYHLEAIISLQSGTSIFFDTFDSRWLNYYPKTMEILFSGVTFPFTNLDFGRFFKVLLILITGFHTIHTVTTNEERLQKLFRIRSSSIMHLYAVIIIVANPVVLYQLPSLYIDDILYLLFINFFFFFSKKQFDLCCISLALMAGGKFSYIAFTGIFFLAILTIQHKTLLPQIWKWLQKTKNIALLCVSFFVGFHQYVLNLLQTGNPLYLFIGKDKENFSSQFLPDQFEPHANIVNFIRSFSSYSHTSCPDTSCWQTINFLGIGKIFSSYKQLLIDTVINGFGSIFSLLLIIGILSFGVGCFYSLQKRRSVALPIVLFLSCFIIINLIPLPSARYYPFIYLVPLLGVYMYPKKFLQYIVIFLYTCNIFFTIYTLSHHHIKIAKDTYRETKWIQQTLSKTEKIHYFVGYTESFSIDKLTWLHKLPKEKIQIHTDKQELLNKCGFLEAPQDHISYCKNGVLLYANYRGFLGEVLFFESTK